MKHVEKILLDNIEAPNVLFVFPTDIAVSSWADHILRLKSGTIAMNKFIAWDKFKQNSIRSQVQSKKSIPSALRKIFVSNLVRENADAAKNKEPLVFSSLIGEEWAQQARQFIPWLTDILPQLGAWFNKKTGCLIERILDTQAETSKFENDDWDMYNLARRYAQFLEKHSLFEQAWEAPPFNNDGKECFIFFPEALNDFCEYEDLLKESGGSGADVKFIYAQDTDSSSTDTFFYTNSRSEITEAALYIRALHENHNINWDSIAVCIPDTENYEPYVLREFANRNIPCVKKTSKPLSDYPAGRFFQSVLDCAIFNYSFSSVVSLIMNKSLPWKNTDLIDKLIKFGINNNCIYSWTEKDKHINIWEDALKKPYEDPGEDVKEFFMELKKHLNALHSSASFSALRRQYFIFRDTFLDINNYSIESNLIMSRCITELTDLAMLENDFPQIIMEEPLAFLAEHLSEVNYLAQTKAGGVAILPYKTAAGVLYDCHVVLGANQDVLSVVYTRLGFLSRKKREELGFIDKDASSAFIKLHKYNSAKRAAFFCSEQTFTGFTIPHSRINAPSDAKERYAPDYKDKFSYDHYKKESMFYSSFNDGAPQEFDILHENQINGFLQWKNRRSGVIHPKKLKFYEEVKNYIHSIYAKSDQPGISPSSLRDYYQCSLHWIFNNVFRLHNVQIETAMMDNMTGSVYHAILNHFFTGLKNKPLLEPQRGDGYNEETPVLPPDYKKRLSDSIDAVFEGFPALLPDKETKMSSLTSRLLRAGKMDYQHNLENSIACFLSFFAGCRVVNCEKYYKIEKDGFILKGSIDFILKDSSEKYIIVDFKLKNLPPRDECTGDSEDGLVNFQLPAYITLVQESEKYKVYTAVFYSILDAKPEVIIGSVINDKGKEIPKEDRQILYESDKYKLIFDEFNKKTEQFAQDISSGDLKVFPKSESDCQKCSYRRICRTVYVIGRENIDSLRKAK